MAEILIKEGKAIKAYRTGYRRRWKDNIKKDVSIVWFPTKTRKVKRMINRGLTFKPEVIKRKRRLFLNRWRTK